MKEDPSVLSIAMISQCDGFVMKAAWAKAALSVGFTAAGLRMMAEKVLSARPMRLRIEMRLIAEVTSKTRRVELACKGALEGAENEQAALQTKGRFDQEPGYERGGRW